MAKRLQIILTVSAVIIFIMALLLDVSQFGQQWQTMWVNLNVSRLLLVVVLVAITGVLLGLILFRRKKYNQRIFLTLPISFIIFAFADITNLAINYYGLDEEYNYFTAKRDLKKGKVTLLETGLTMPIPNIDWDKQKKAATITENSFGYKSVYTGCIITHGIDMYNHVMEDYLNKRNGKDWRVKSAQLFDSLVNDRN